MTDHPNAIKLDPGAALTDESVEVARIWITNNAGSNVLIDAGILEDPTVFGYLLAGDRLSGLAWFGAGLIMAAIVAVELGPRIRPPRPLPEG